MSLSVWNIEELVRTKFTPDVPHLLSRTAWYVFMYDDYSIETQRSAIAFTRENYLLYRNEKENFLVALSATERDQVCKAPSWTDPIKRHGAFCSAPAMRIRGNLHLLSPQEIIKIDTDTMNTVMFKRKFIPCLIPTRQAVTFPNSTPFYQLLVTQIHAWIWEGNRAVFEPEIDNNPDFQPADALTPDSLWIGSFYTKEKQLR